MILQQESSEAYSIGWCFGENDRSGKKGDFPAECVYLLPTMTKPPPEILQLFALQSMEKANEIITANQSQMTYSIDDKGHTLEQYSYDHFRYVLSVLLMSLKKKLILFKNLQQIRLGRVNFFVVLINVLTHQCLKIKCCLLTNVVIAIY